MKRKINIGASLSRNYNTAKLEILEEEIEFETEVEFNQKVQRLFSQVNGNLEAEMLTIGGLKK